MHSKGSVALLSVMAASVSAQWGSYSQAPPASSSVPVGPVSVSSVPYGSSSEIPYPKSSEVPYGSSEAPYYPASSSAAPYYPGSSSIPVYPQSVSSYPAYGSSSIPVYPQSVSSYPQPYGSSSEAYPGSTQPPYPVSTSQPPYPSQSSWGSIPVGPVSFSTSGTYPAQSTGSLTYSAAAAPSEPAAKFLRAREANAGVSQYSVPFIGIGFIMAAGGLLAM